MSIAEIFVQLKRRKTEGSFEVRDKKFVESIPLEHHSRDLLFNVIVTQLADLYPLKIQSVNFP